MASGTAKSPRARSPVAESHSNVEAGSFIEQQLAKTRRRVKLVDLGSRAMGLIGGVLLYTLSVVLIDHWLFELSTLGRLLALAILVVGGGYYCAAFVIPLMVRRINPNYAARAIEQSAPSLKNSLINFLMFRRDGSPTGRLVHRAMRQRAALDLRQVDIDLAVDRTRLIHVGYVVVTLMILFAVYTILSPKDVFQTIKRVSAPWADIARPSRVTIEDVQPGDQVEILGRQIEVSARILGVREEDSVTLLFTTEDNQTVDRAVAMTPPETGQRYTCTIPGDDLGLRQNLRYRIEAGDATSSEFEVSVLDVPSIVVDKIEYDYPPYTRREKRVTQGVGEIHAVEGTRVTVHARANHPIKKATLEFDPDGKSTRQTMQSNEREASYQFPLAWDEDRGAPQYPSYRLLFEPQLSLTSKGHLESQLSAVHKISVIRDLPPEIAILTPQRKQIELPVNRVQRIEIRALDPDFGLARIVLQADANDTRLINEPLLENESGFIGQVVVEYDFVPSQLGLVPGDKITFSAHAEDNRPPISDGMPQPNKASTDDYFITIIGGDPNEPNDTASRPGGEQANDAQDNSTGVRQQQPTPASPRQEDPRQNDDQSADQQGADAPQSASDAQNEKSDSGQQQASPQQSGDQGNQNSSGQTDAAEQGTPGDSGGQQSDASQEAQQGQQTEGEQAGSGGSTEDGNQQGDAAGQMQSGSQSGAGSTGETGSQQSSGSGGEESGANPGQPSQTSESRGNGANNAATDSQSAQDGSEGDQDAVGGQRVREEPLHDGEVIERVLRHFEKDGRGAQPAGQNQLSDRADGSRANQDTTQQDRSGATGDQPRQDDSTGGESTAQEGSEGRDSPSNDAAKSPDGPSDPAAGQETTSSANPSDQPGNKGLNNAGQGDNNDPDQGAGEKQEVPETPQAAEGSETTDNPDAGTSQKQSGLGDEGDAGSGRGADDSAGSPGSQKANRDRDKTTQEGNRESSDDESAQGVSQSKSQSDSQGDQGGAQSGGGQKGGGQPADQPGRDSPGSNMSSDQGNTGSPESGQDETSDRAGDKQPSSDVTGQSGRKPGAGGQSQALPEGQQQTRDGAAPPSTESPTETNSDRQPSPDQLDPSKSASGGRSSGPPQGGGIPGEARVAPSDQELGPPEGDEANLDYARNATDLVLERLKDQQEEPDPELLKSLGWTKEELQKFVARWEAMKRDAREHVGDAQSELDDALRSLGLRADSPGRLRSSARDDRPGGLRDSGNRIPPPPAFLEKFKAYKKGAARGQPPGR